MKGVARVSSNPMMGRVVKVDRKRGAVGVPRAWSPLRHADLLYMHEACILSSRCAEVIQRGSIPA